MSFASAEECKKWLERCDANASVRSKKDFGFKLNKIKGLVGSQVEVCGSSYFLPNKDRVINVRKVQVLQEHSKKIHLERIS